MNRREWKSWRQTSVVTRLPLLLLVGFLRFGRCAASVDNTVATGAPDTPIVIPESSHLLEQAKRQARDDQILAAARTLKKVLELDPSLVLDEALLKVIDVAHRVEETIMDLSKPPDPAIWTQQGDLHHNYKEHQRDFAVHHKLDAQRRLTSRIELLMEKSLLKPLAAVLIETELYNTWMPRWNIPPVGVANVQKLGQTGRTQQILHLDLDIPFRRDLIIVSNGVEDVDENGLFAIHLGTYPAGHKVEPNLVIPSPKVGVKRIDFEGCFVFQKCPLSHPLWNRRLAETETDQGTQQSSHGDMMLVSFSMFADAKIPSLFPQWITNFVLRVAIAKFFIMFLAVAEDVQSGKRLDHTSAIEKKKDDIYNWIDQLVETMIAAEPNVTLPGRL